MPIEVDPRERTGTERTRQYERCYTWTETSRDESNQELGRSVFFILAGPRGAGAAGGSQERPPDAAEAVGLPAGWCAGPAFHRHHH
eukprot:8316778-Pyramimonas_sp.AAC.1